MKLSPIRSLIMLTPWLVTFLMAGAPLVRAAPPHMAETMDKERSFDALMARAEQYRRTGKHDLSARSYAAAYRSLAGLEGVGLLAELAVDNAITDYRVAFEQQSAVLEWLEEPLVLLDELVPAWERAHREGQAEAVPPRLLSERTRLREQLARALPINGSIRVTMDTGSADEALLPLWILRRHSGMAQSLSRPEHEQWIEIVITGIPDGYRLIAVPIRDGEPIGRIPEPVECSAEARVLLDLVDERIARAVEVLSTTPAVIPFPENPLTSDDDEARPSARVFRSVFGTSVGGATIIGGLAMAITGGIMSRQYELHPDAGFLRVSRYPRAPTLLGIGIGIMAAGVIPLTIGACGLRKRRRGTGCLPKRESRRQALARPMPLRGSIDAFGRVRF